MSIKVIGYEIAPKKDYNRQLMKYVDSLSLGAAAVQPPMPATPIYGNANGDQYVALPTEDCVQTLPFIPGSAADGELGGFCSIDEMPESEAGDSVKEVLSKLHSHSHPQLTANWMDKAAANSMLAGAPGTVQSKVLSDLGIKNPLAGGLLGMAMGAAAKSAGLGPISGLFGGGGSGGNSGASGDMAKMLDDLGVVPLMPMGGQGGGQSNGSPQGGSGFSTQDLLGLLSGGGMPGMNGISDAMKNMMPKGADQVSNILPGGCMPGSSSGFDPKKVASEALEGAADDLLKQWKVDDESSAAEHVAHKIVNDNKDKIKGAIKDPDGTLKSIKKFFNGATSSAVLPAARITDNDLTAPEVIGTGAAMVLAENLPIARMTDKLAPSQAMVLEGSSTVLSQGLPTARITSKTDSPGVMIVKGAASVLVGGTSASISPPPPPPTAAPGGNGGPAGPASPSAPGTGSSGSGATNTTAGANPTSKYPMTKDGKLKIGDYEVNPNDPYAIKEAEAFKDLPRLPRDPSGDPANYPFITDSDNPWIPGVGMGATPDEYNNLPDTPDWLRGILQADGQTSSLGLPVKEGNWYLLGGLIDLGSPLNPGAGTGDWTWVVPDKIFGMDMSAYYLPHDWKFIPETYGKEGKPFWDMYLDWELGPFLSGIEAAKGNPIHMGLQVIYSGATSVVSALEWMKGRNKRNKK